MRTPETLVRVKVSYKMVARGCIRGWCVPLLGLGVLTAGPVATPSAAACLPLQDVSSSFTPNSPFLG